MFLKPVLEYYEANVKKQDAKAKEAIKQMLSIVPRLSELKRGLNHRLPKENIVYKLVLDVMAHNLRASDQQFSKAYAKILQMRIRLYETITIEEIN